jgi:hypothetical protein
MVRHELLWTT